MEASPKQDSNRLPPLGAGSKLLLVQPDAVLCKLCVRGSDDAFAVLHARYRQQVFAFVFHLLGRGANQADAEDLTQEIFSKAFTAMRDRREGGSFKSWLFVIARNSTFDHIRARKPQSVPLDEAPENSADNVVSLDTHVERRGELAWLVTAMADLPERQREALVLRELGGMSYGAIAESLDTSAESVKQLIKRGRSTVSVAAEQNGYRSRKLSRDLAMAAPIAPIAALGLGTSAAGAAVGGGGLLAVGGKVAATVAAVAVIGGGTAVVGEQVASSRSENKTSGTSANIAPMNAEGSGWGVGGVPPGAAVSAEAKRVAAERREQRAKERAAAKRKKARAKAKAKAKRVKAKAKAKAKRLRAQANAEAQKTKTKTSEPAKPNPSSGGGSSSGGAKKSEPQQTESAPDQPSAGGGKGNGGGPKK